MCECHKLLISERICYNQTYSSSLPKLFNTYAFIIRILYNFEPKPELFSCDFCKAVVAFIFDQIFWILAKFDERALAHTAVFDQLPVKIECFVVLEI